MNNKMEPIILFRQSLADEEEINCAKNYLKVITQRSQVKKNQLIIPRYSALPFYKELEYDVEYLGGKLLNSYKEHNYVADLQNWYQDLVLYTPKTWFRLEDIPNGGPFVLKGQTNSKKHNWNTHVFAKNKKEAVEVYSRLLNDTLIGTQQIYIRQYVPLRKLCDGFQGLPISEEYRFFVLDGKILTGAFYWSEHTEYIKEELKIDINHKQVPEEFLQEIISSVSSNIRFFVVDVARTEEGKWVVVELNDGQCSGLSDNDPDILYKNMKIVLNGCY